MNHEDRRVNRGNSKFLPFHSTDGGKSLVCTYWGLAEVRTDVQSKERVPNMMIKVLSASQRQVKQKPRIHS